MAEKIIAAELAELFDAFDPERVAVDRLAPPTTEWNNSNDFYGIAGVIKAAAGLQSEYTLKGSVTHGHFIEYAWDLELRAPLPVMFGMDQNYAVYLQGLTAKLPIALGPYLHYARPGWQSGAGETLKAALGSTLLVMPPHSTHHVDSRFEHDFLLEKLKPLRERFQSILVVIYWKDVLEGRAEVYLQAGLIPVCAGHMFDWGFMARLRGLMELADAAYFMGRGSQLPFWMSLGKPMLFAQPGEKLSIVPRPGHNRDVAGPSSQRDHYLAALDAAFGHADQDWPHSWRAESLLPFRRICGLDSLREPWELRGLLLLAEALHQSWRPGQALTLPIVAEALLTENRHAEAALVYKELWLREEKEQWHENMQTCLAALCPSRPWLALNPDPAWELSREWVRLGLPGRGAATAYPLDWGSVPLPEGSIKLLLLRAADAEHAGLRNAMLDALRALRGQALCVLSPGCADLPSPLLELTLTAAVNGAAPVLVERIKRSCTLMNVEFCHAKEILQCAELLHQGGVKNLCLCRDSCNLPEQTGAFFKRNDFCCLLGLREGTQAP